MLLGHVLNQEYAVLGFRKASYGGLYGWNPMTGAGYSRIVPCKRLPRSA